MKKNLANWGTTTLIDKHGVEVKVGETLVDIKGNHGVLVNISHVKFIKHSNGSYTQICRVMPSEIERVV